MSPQTFSNWLLMAAKRPNPAADDTSTSCSEIHNECVVLLQRLLYILTAWCRALAQLYIWKLHYYPFPRHCRPLWSRTSHFAEFWILLYVWWVSLDERSVRIGFLLTQDNTKSGKAETYRHAKSGTRIHDASIREVEKNSPLRSGGQSYQRILC